MRTFKCSLLGAAGWVVASGLPAFAQDAPGATTDPEVVIYRLSGIIDTGNGVLVTLFTCSNRSSVEEGVRIAVRSVTGALIANTRTNVNSLASFTWATRAGAAAAAQAFVNTDPPLGPGPITVNPPGHATIA